MFRRLCFVLTSDFYKFFFALEFIEMVYFITYEIIQKKKLWIIL